MGRARNLVAHTMPVVTSHSRNCPGAVLATVRRGKKTVGNGTQNMPRREYPEFGTASENYTSCVKIAHHYTVMLVPVVQRLTEWRFMYPSGQTVGSVKILSINGES